MDKYISRPGIEYARGAYDLDQGIQEEIRFLSDHWHENWSWSRLATEEQDKEAWLSGRDL